MTFVATTVMAREVLRKRVLEVGSADVNGTPRRVLLPLHPAEYIGVDQAPGPGVDMVVDAKALEAVFGPGSFDLVVCTEVLEHVPDWRAVVTALKRVLRVGGVLLLTTRAPGFPYHPYPVDCWRYTIADFYAIFRDLAVDVLEPDPLVPGVFLRARKPVGWAEIPLIGIDVTAVVH